MGYVYAAVLIAVAFVAVVRATRPSKKSEGPFPPGPPTLPFVGNVHQMPATKQFLEFADWSRTYGAKSDGLIGLRLGPFGQIVVLNKWRHVRDLYDSRNAIYSDRPFVGIADYIAGDKHLALMPYGPKWRRTRRAVADFLKESHVDKLQPIRDAEVSQLLYDLLVDGPGSEHHIMRCFGGVVMASVYGTRSRTFDGDSLVRRFFSVQEEWTAILNPGCVPPFEAFPWLRYVPDVLTPWRGWRQRADDIRARQSGLYRELFEGAKARIGRGRSKDCFVAGMIREQEQAEDGGEFSQDDMDYVAGVLMEGGSDTTAAALSTFIMIMANRPDLQREAQEEVDRAFGRSMPRNVQKSQIPFLWAFFLEALRWRPGFAGSFPHTTTKDDTYMGYFIPKGTMIMQNTWAIHHDPEEFENPDEFDPRRYLDNRFGTKPKAESAIEMGETKVRDRDSVTRKQTYAFGAARRACPGKYMAEVSMMLAMAKLMWAFNIVRLQEEPFDTDVRTGFKDSVLNAPKEYKVWFEARDEHRKEVILQEWARADAFLREFE